MQNLRAFTRTDFVGMVTMAWPDRPHGDAVWGKDLSENGMFLQTTSPFRVGDRLQLHFPLLGGEVRVEEAEVRWIRKFEPVSVDGSLPGIGVHFITMAEDCRTVLRRFIDETRQQQPARPVPEIASTMRMFAAPSAPSPKSVTLPPQTPVTVSPAGSEPPHGAGDHSVSSTVPPLTLLSSPPMANWQGWRFDRVHVAPAGPPVTASTPPPVTEPPAPPMMIFDPGQNSAAQPLAKFEEATLDESEITLKTNTERDFQETDVTAPPHMASAWSQSMPPAPMAPPRPQIVRADAMTATSVEKTAETAKWALTEADTPLQRPFPNLSDLPSSAVEPSEPYRLNDPFPEGSAAMRVANDDRLDEDELAALRSRKQGGGFWPKALMVTIGAGLGIWMGVPGTGAVDSSTIASEATAAPSAPAPLQAVADAERALPESAVPSRLERTLAAAAQITPLPDTPLRVEPVVPAAPPAAALTAATKASTAEKPTPIRQATTLASAVRPKPSAAKVRVARSTPLITATDGGASVRIKGGDIISVFGLEHPARVVVDLEGAQFPGFVTENVNAHGVKRLRVGKPDNKRMRVVIELDREMRPRGIMADKADGALSVRWR